MGFSVYLHIAPNGKKYVGITSRCVDKRWQNGNGYKSQIFYRAIKKYGWDNIEHIVLFENLTKDEAEEKEKELINKYNSNNPKFGYNRNEGGLGNKGSTISEETRKKISVAQKKRFEREEEREKLRSYAKGRTPWNKGLKTNEDVRKKLSEAHKGKSTWIKGKTHSKETKKKLSEIQIGKKLKEETKNKIHEANSYIVLKYNLNGDLIGTYKGSREASKSVGKENGNSSITKCCRGEQKTAYGYIWKYKQVIKDGLSVKE